MKTKQMVALVFGIICIAVLSVVLVLSLGKKPDETPVTDQQEEVSTEDPETSDLETNEEPPVTGDSEDQTPDSSDEQEPNEETPDNDETENDTPVSNDPEPEPPVNDIPDTTVQNPAVR